ncbi:hypothetical protein K457DRAFT_243961 [Linnemannia elongata AG-77]|uniref:Uncharacterized protein n=1 Tax=Linnemannia elongata AG-77 TaxID=1314771 RepID=A0A197JF97_9FUNG|nr:hypothetical protein K457DRAFT_243961 [Linnemannia elongata AG-77]
MAIPLHLPSYLPSPHAIFLSFFFPFSDGLIWRHHVFAYVNRCIQSLSFQTAHCKPVEPKKSNEEEEEKKNKVELERRTKSNTYECLIGGGWIGCLCFYNTNDSGCSFNSLFDILNFVRE